MHNLDYAPPDPKREGQGNCGIHPGGVVWSNTDLGSLGGRKDDQGKPRMDLIAPEIMVALGEILAFGANKYAPRNWEKGMSWGRVYGALQRHLWAWQSGESNDPETGKSHLWHAACCLMFLVAYEQRGIGVDDRA